MFTTRALKQIIARTIAFHPAYALLGGSVEAGLFLSQACYWTTKLPPSRDGWFFKTRDEWHEETMMARTQQEKARRVWVKLGVLQEKREGIPAKLHFRIDLERLGTLLESLPTSWQETSQLDGMEPTNSTVGNQPTLLLQRLPSESTTENKEPKAPLRGSAIDSSKLPEWLPQEDWQDFLEMRRKIRAPLTLGGEKRIIATLGKMKVQGYDVKVVLGLSIENSWRGVFPPKENGNSPPRGAGETFLEAQNRRSDEAIKRFAAKHASEVV
jgi:hypothetical protein